MLSEVSGTLEAFRSFYSFRSLESSEKLSFFLSKKLEPFPLYIILLFLPQFSRNERDDKNIIDSFFTVSQSSMAAMLACRRGGGAPIAKLLEMLLANPARALEASTQSAARSFSTNAQMRDPDGDERGLDVDRRSDGRLSRRRGRRDEIDAPFFAGVFDPFNPSRSLSQVLNLMDQMTDSPFPVSARGMGGGARRGWDAREDEDALHLRIDMPGLGKEHVKVGVEQSTLIIRGEGEKESEQEEEAGRRYSSRIDLPEGLYKMDQIKAEMKNGVLKVVVPKVREDERKDVFQVQIE